MPANVDALRKRVEETQATLDELKAEFAKDQSKSTGRRLLKAREKASEARQELYAACPEEKPPTLRIGM